jgi:DNA modification methylase
MSEEDILPPEKIDTKEHSIIQGDATSLPFDDSEFHAIVTDPPYAFDGGFMNKEWDDFSDSKQYQLWCEEWAEESLRVLKPGGHMVAFSSSKKFHRLICGVEDAGFEIRDTIMWMYGSGFPKSHNIEKAINQKEEDEQEHFKRKFAGFGTELKPAFEPIVLVRKPIEEDTIAEQVMETGTGGLNIDGTRIDYNSEEDKENHKQEWDREQSTTQSDVAYNYDDDREGGEDLKKYKRDDGRFPANIVLDQMADNLLDEEVGETAFSSGGNSTNKGGWVTENKDEDMEGVSCGYGDTGGPSRYFYTSKSSKSERTMDGTINNPHPTVKPVDLMEWLVKLVTTEEQKVLDPFLGSGTTLIACARNNRVGTGLDMNQHYCKLATKRLGCELGTELGNIFDY